MSKRIRQALVRKIKSGQHGSFYGNDPEGYKAEAIKYLTLKPGTDIEYMFRNSFMVVSYYKHRERLWVHKLTDGTSVHNVLAEVTENEL
jgi:hypothetical protein